MRRPQRGQREGGWPGDAGGGRNQSGSKMLCCRTIFRYSMVLRLYLVRHLISSHSFQSPASPATSRGRLARQCFSKASYCPTRLRHQACCVDDFISHTSCTSRNKIKIQFQTAKMKSNMVFVAFSPCTFCTKCATSGSSFGSAITVSHNAPRRYRASVEHVVPFMVLQESALIKYSENVALVSYI